jgi:hypothetical protein
LGSATIGGGTRRILHFPIAAAIIINQGAAGSGTAAGVGAADSQVRASLGIAAGPGSVAQNSLPCFCASDATLIQGLANARVPIWGIFAPANFFSFSRGAKFGEFRPSAPAQVVC